MLATKPQPMRAEDYIEWVLRQPERYELCDGEPIAMAAERRGHTRMKVRVFDGLRDAIGQAKLPCEPVMDGASVRVDDYTVYEPDVSVTCEGADDPDDSMFVTAPVIVVEVASPSTSGIDFTRKFYDYFRIPSVQHYLVIDTAKRELFHGRRTGENQTENHIHADGKLRLDPPGIELDIDALFSKERN